MKTLQLPHLLLGILVTFIWGLNFTVTRIGLDDDAGLCDNRIVGCAHA